MEQRRKRARRWIIASYGFLCVSAVIEFINAFTEGNFQESQLKFQLSTVLIAIMPFAGLFGWWFLTRVFVDNDVDRSLSYYAFVGLTLQAFVYGAADFLLIYSFDPFTTFSGSHFWSWLQSLEPWLTCAGLVASAMGLFLMTLTYSKHARVPPWIEAFDASMNEEGPDVPFEELGNPRLP